MIKVGSATINSCDGVENVFAMEVVGVEDENVYLTRETVEYLYAQMANLLGKEV